LKPLELQAIEEKQAIGARQPQVAIGPLGNRSDIGRGAVIRRIGEMLEAGRQAGVSGTGFAPARRMASPAARERAGMRSASLPTDLIVEARSWFLNGPVRDASIA
jgi:hypothetical protein